MNLSGWIRAALLGGVERLADKQWLAVMVMATRIKSASVYRKEGSLYFCSQSASGRAWIQTGPFIKLDMKTNPLAIGDAVLQVLSSSQDHVPYPTDWASVTAPLLKLAGVKSWLKFARNSQCVGIESDEEHFRMIPYRNLDKEGFEQIDNRSIDLPISSSISQVAAALEDALTLCE